MIECRREKFLPVLLMGLAILVSSVLAKSAAGGTFFEDFESYGAGSDLHGQGGWKGWDNDPIGGAPVSAAFAHGGRHSVEIGGSADLVHEFDAVGGQWTFTTQQYLPSDAVGESWLILMNRYVDNENDDDRSWSLQLVFDLNAGTVSDYDFGGEATLIYDGWTEIRVEVDLNSNTRTAYYNDKSVATGPWYGAEPAIAAIDFFGNGASAVYYDDVRLVPEPRGISILLGSVLSLACRRRRQARISNRVVG